MNSRLSSIRVLLVCIVSMTMTVRIATAAPPVGVIAMNMMLSASEHEADDDDDDEEDDDEDDDHDGLEWNDDDHVPGAGRHQIRATTEGIESELADLRRIRSELERRIAEHQKQLKAAPGVVDPVGAKAEELKRQAILAKQDAASANSKLTRAQRDAMLLFREVREEARAASEEREAFDCELLSQESQLGQLKDEARQSLARSPQYRLAVEVARTSALRLEIVREQHKAGRATPTDLVDAMNFARQATASVSQLEDAVLANNVSYKQVKSEMEETRHRMGRYIALREAIARSDPRVIESRATLRVVQNEHADASTSVFTVNRAQTQANSKLAQMKRQIKAFEGDVDRMIAAKAALDKRIRDREADLKDLEQPVAEK